MSQANVILGIAGTQAADATLPGLLQAGSRGSGTPGGGTDPFINAQSVRAKAVFDLPRPARGAEEPQRSSASLAADDLLTLEATDGTTIFMRADRLRAEAARLMPAAIDADGRLNIDLLHGATGTSRGAGEWLWRKVSVLELLPDDIIEAAKQQAVKWLGDSVKDSIVDRASLVATRLGTRALLAVIESRLPRGPGLYRWKDGAEDSLAQVGPQELAAAGDQPLLLFIHGTASSTSGSFGDLGKAGAGWGELVRRFGANIYAFEHRTFSESPIDNALALAAALPDKARLNIVTHSRGGQVGDLLCLAAVDDKLINGWRRVAHEGGADSAADLQQVVAEEKAKLMQLRDLLNARNFQIERYVRVASPARGTRLAGGNFDVFLSALLNLIGLVPALSGSLLYSAVKRIVLEIAHNRTDPAWVPGIEAMLPNSPLTDLLAAAQRKQGIQMAVIAGDIEGGSLLQRIGVMFTDWMFFDEVDNDLVVDTDSMFAGLARRPGARYLFQQGANVSHFRYFDNAASRQALQDWLTHDTPAELATFEPIPGDGDWARVEKDNGRKREAERTRAAPGSRPVVYVLPGIMGSHLALARDTSAPGAPAHDRIWFDVPDLACGGLKRIAWQQQPAGTSVSPDGMFEMFYGDCCKHLDTTHEVVPFAYDWRLPIEQEAERLAAALRATLSAVPDQPVRLLAHSMGGLVVRAMIALHPDVWRDIVARSGGRLVMMGTPNNGSHLMVETLLGKSDTIRKLARVDLSHDLQEVLDIVADFRGALQLLPRPAGFTDTGTTGPVDYFDGAQWADYKGKVFDTWFGDHVAAQPSAAAFADARKLWSDILPDNKAPEPTDRVAYVFGVAEKTPCGLAEENGKLSLVGTALGDGSVTWASGNLDNLPTNRRWYLPAAHGDLLDTPEYFDAIAELLTAGTTRQLNDTPPVTRAAGMPPTFRYDAGPTPIPGEEEMARSLLGSRAAPKLRRSALVTLQVAICAQDLRFAQSPVVCGHYRGDAITGAEDQLDRHVVSGALRQREHLGMYAGDIGSSALALLPGSAEERRRGSQRGALVVGLGEYGSLTQRQLADTIRAGTLRFLLHQQELNCTLDTGRDAAIALTLSPLLIGFSSTSNMDIDHSIEAIILGVAEANSQFRAAQGAGLHVGRIEFTEVFVDSAISAARALPAVAARMASPLASLETRLQLAAELEFGSGARPRLQSSAGDNGYWSRLMVTAADDCKDTESAPTDPSKPDADTKKLAQQLRFVFLSTRARAERVVQQRQPGLIEKLVAKSIGSDAFDLDQCRSLYELMVPVDFKGAANNTERLLLVVDGYTANLPWEMLVAGNQPLVVNTAVVRQLATSRFRIGVRTTQQKTAYVVGNPSTAGFLDAFTQYWRDPTNTHGSLVALDGAETEANDVVTLLRSNNYEVKSPAIGQEFDALKVIGGLYRQPYRIIHIAAHGIVDAKDGDGGKRTGVVLSDGLLITAAEIGQLEVVPDLVFLNCCHLGTADNLPRDGNRIAYSLARELIEMGVRCVVAAGWAVNDQAASRFATTLYASMLKDNACFGDAVSLARRTIYAEYPNCNTWGAYQAYGDPMFRFDASTEPDSYGDGWQAVTPCELIDAIERESTNAAVTARGADATTEQERMVAKVRRWMERAPLAWHARADLHYALGCFFGALGSPHFEQAIEAYRQAVSGGDGQVSAPIKAIEQLADLEVRHGIECGDKALIEKGLQRLRALLADALPNSGVERWVVLGNACMAVAQAKAAEPRAKWKDLVPLLNQARDAYTSGFDAAPLPPPELSLQRLQLDAILGDAKDAKSRGHALDAARAVADEAGRRFARSGDFFDAVMSVDVEVAGKLLEGKLAQTKLRDELTDAYRQAIRKVSHSKRQIDVLTRQLRLLARFLSLKDPADKAIAALEHIAQALESANELVGGGPD